MPRAAAIFDVPTTGGVVRVYIPAPEPTDPAPGLVKRSPDVVEAEGDPQGDWADVIPLRRSA